MQNRAARVITGKPYDTKISDILNVLDWQPLADRRKFKKYYLCAKSKIINFQKTYLACLELIETKTIDYVETILTIRSQNLKRIL